METRKPEPFKDRLVKQHAKAPPIDISTKHVAEDSSPQVDPKLLSQFKEMHQEEVTDSYQGYKEVVYESTHKFQEAEVGNIRCLCES